MTFKRLSEYFQQLEQNTSRLKITEILAELFKECSEEEIDKICYLSLGRLLPQYRGIEFQMAEKMMEKAVAKTVGVGVDKVVREYKKVGDLGIAAQDLKKLAISRSQRKLFGEIREIRPASTAKRGEEIGVAKVYERLMEIAKESGGGSVERKVDKMAALLQDLDELSVRYVIRMPLGKMRMGFSEMTILDGLSWMINRDKSLREKLEDAYNMVADIGEIARKIRPASPAKRGEEIGDIGGIKNIKPKLGTPIMPALCQRIGTAEGIIEKLGEVAVEPKYDGTRLQVHFDRENKENKGNEGIKVFTRNLENVTDMFPEIVSALPKEIKADEAVFDGEGVGVDLKTGKFIPFQETIKRKRKHDIVQTAKDIPLKYFVFDILYKDGESLIKEPFSKRREILKKVIGKDGFTVKLSPQILTSDPKELKKYHGEQIQKGLEGIVAKKWQSFYEPGRRGFHWVKLKQEETKKGGGLADTIDCVVMGIYRGRGKRASFGVGAFLAGVRRGEKFVTISKIGTGLTDEQFRELKVKSSKFKVKKKPKEYEVDKNLAPDFWLEPQLVVEIQADNITKSPIHTAGLALRFPRLIRFKDDRSPQQATTVREVGDLFRLQFEGN